MLNDGDSPVQILQGKVGKPKLAQSPFFEDKKALLVDNDCYHLVETGQHLAKEFRIPTGNCYSVHPNTSNVIAIGTNEGDMLITILNEPGKNVSPKVCEFKRVHTSPIVALTYSANAKYLMSASSDNVVHLFSTEQNYELVKSLKFVGKTCRRILPFIAEGFLEVYTASYSRKTHF